MYLLWVALHRKLFNLQMLCYKLIFYKLQPCIVIYHNSIWSLILYIIILYYKTYDLRIRSFERRCSLWMQEGHNKCEVKSWFIGWLNGWFAGRSSVVGRFVSIICNQDVAFTANSQNLKMKLHTMYLWCKKITNMILLCHLPNIKFRSLSNHVRSTIKHLCVLPWHILVHIQHYAFTAKTSSLTVIFCAFQHKASCVLQL